MAEVIDGVWIGRKDGTWTVVFSMLLPAAICCRLRQQILPNGDSKSDFHLRSLNVDSTRHLPLIITLQSTMSGRTLTLPIRTLASGRQVGSQWICRRCLATQAESSESRPLITPPTPLPEWYDPSLPASKRLDPEGNPYRLTKTDMLLKKRLDQDRIPAQYLTHTTAEHLHEKEKAQREHTKPHTRIVGVVVRSGRMAKTVTVRVAGQRFQKQIKKVRRRLLMVRTAG